MKISLTPRVYFLGLGTGLCLADLLNRWHGTLGWIGIVMIAALILQRREV